MLAADVAGTVSVAAFSVVVVLIRSVGFGSLVGLVGGDAAAVVGAVLLPSSGASVGRSDLESCGAPLVAAARCLAALAVERERRAIGGEVVDELVLLSDGVGSSTVN